MFAELHTHTDIGSNVRLVDSTCNVSRLINKAAASGFVGVAITDHESLSAHIKAIKRAKEIRKENPDFKLILGNEIYLINESDYKNTDKFWHFILLAKDAEGHRQLRTLSTLAWSRAYTHKHVERVPTFYSDLYTAVSANPGHLIASTACLGSYFDTLLLSGEADKALTFANWCKSLFGPENFFIEMQPGITEEQILYNKAALQFCKENAFNWIFTNDVHYLSANKRPLHSAFLNSKNEERETGDFYESTYFKTEAEMLERMPYFETGDIEQGFYNTVKIARSVEQYDLKHEVVVPLQQLPNIQVQHIFKDWYDKYPSIKQFAYSGSDQNRYCLMLCEQGFLEKKQAFNETNLARLDVELAQLIGIENKIKQSIAGYYNIVRWLVDLMWDDEQGNSLVGVSRGSAGAFYLCYLMGITQINPIEWDLPWFRHLAAERPELPDSDLIL